MSTNDFTLIDKAKEIIIIIFMLSLLVWLIRRVVEFTNVYFQVSAMAELRKQAFSYMMGHLYSFFANNFSGSLTQKINKYAKAFGRLMDSLVDEVVPLFLDL